MLRFGLVGCGRIAVRHAELLARGHISGARLAAVCDSVPERARAFGEKYGVPAFSDMHEMARGAELDAFSVLTPSGLHAKHVIELAAHGKHIVVEKPMALTLDDADAMIAACDRSRVKLFVVKQNRFNRPVVKLREALEAGRFGKLVLGTVRVRWCRTQEYYDQDSWRGTWALDGGVLSNQASHHVDLLEWMMGAVDSVYAKGMTALARIEAEDTAAVVLKFRNGALGIIEATTAARPKDLEGSLSVLGEKGAVEIGGFAVNEMKVWEFSERHASDTDVRGEYSVNPPNVYGFGHHAYYEHVVNCITNNAQQLVDGLEGRKSLELITAIYESIETGREIRAAFFSVARSLGTRLVKEPTHVSTASVVDVEFGPGVRVVHPVNLYGCTIGEGTFIGPFVEIQRGAAVGAHCKVQSHSFICELVTIGDNCFVGHGVMFINDTFAEGAPAGGDRTKWRSTRIGNRVSIGSNATLLPVTIVDDVVIGAGSVVTKDLLRPGIYAGNPARFVRTTGRTPA